VSSGHERGTAIVNQTSTPPDHGNDTVHASLLFSRKLQTLTNRVHATSNIDEIMLDLSNDICQLFSCERLTIYAVSEDRVAIETKVKTGMSSFKDFALPIAESSIAGYVALFKKMVNVRNVYDERELKSYTPRLNFVSKVDVRTGYVTQQTLAAPITNSQTNELLGVVQLINSRDQKAFSHSMEEGVRELCATLAIAFMQRLKPPPVIRSKYDPLVVHSILSMPELGLASRSARRKGLEVEDVLINEFQVRLSDIGESIGRFFGVPYEPYREQRKKPSDALIYFDPVEIVSNRWLPLEEKGQALTVLTTDPERVKRLEIVGKTFPKSVISYRVTTNHEFRLTADQLFGTVDDAGVAKKSSWGFEAMPVCAAAEEMLANRVHTAIMEAFRQEDTGDIAIVLHPDSGKTVSRFYKNGSLESIRGSTSIEYQVNFSEEDDREDENHAPARE
jgi:hypothetical protein